MTNILKRVPPPPPIAQNDPVFNRWLHDLTSFITEGGGIDPGAIPGYDVLLSTVALHSSQIANHTIQIASNTSNISSLFTITSAHTAQINANTTAISNNTTNIGTLFARSQVLSGAAAPAAGTGVDGDWFSDTIAKHIYVKSGGAWVLIV